MTKEQFIYALTACGCLLKDGKTWYEHNELIECFENLGLFEQEPRCKNCKWWKDSDGQCPINPHIVHCYMFSPMAESEVKR